MSDKYDYTKLRKALNEGMLIVHRETVLLLLADLDTAYARCADCTTEHLAAQARVEGLERVRDMLAVMGADLDAETTNAGSTPEDWIAEAQRRLARVDGIQTAALNDALGKE